MDEDRSQVHVIGSVYPWSDQAASYIWYAEETMIADASSRKPNSYPDACGLLYFCIYSPRPVTNSQLQSKRRNL